MKTSRSGRNITERSYRVLDLATLAARELGHSAVLPAHIALGLLREGEGVAATAIQTHGVVLKDLMKDLESALTTQAAGQSTKPELTPDAEQLIDRAVEEARSLGHPYTGTEHLLLALLRDPAASVSQLLANRGFSHAMARARILWILGGDPDAPQEFVTPVT
jgi:ATP-dependent Clp protease ATP-binding subunit ClpC